MRIAAIIVATILFVGFGGHVWWSRDPAGDPSWAEPKRSITDPDTGRAYRLERLFVPSGEHRIAATFLHPEGDELAPVVIVVSGSGTGILPAEGPLHRRLLARGYAVLSLGKKGVGASSGDWRDETFEDRARNVSAAVDWVMSRSDIDRTKLVLFGHSQGGYVVPLLANDARVAALILAATSTEIVRQQIATETYTTALRLGASPQEARAKADSGIGMLDALLSGCGLHRYHYLCHVYHFDPQTPLSTIKKPILALFGENDVLAPPEPNLKRMRALLSGNPSAQVVVLPEANHLFWKSVSGVPAEYDTLVGPEASFPFQQAGNPDHERLRAVRANRVRFADGYFEAIETFLERYTPAIAEAS